jgi:hypothetical protein
VLLAASLGVFGCAQEPAPPPVVALGAAQQHAVAADPGDVHLPKTKPKSAHAAVAAVEQPANAPAEPAPAAPPTAAPAEQPAVAELPTAQADPKELVGLDEEQTAQLLGAPSRTGEQPPAKYWQYDKDDCVLKVFFFMDLSSQDFRALSYEMMSKDDEPDVNRRCFAQLLAQSGSRDASQQRSGADSPH